MSAFDRLLAGSSGSAAPSGSSQTSNDPSSPLPPVNKAEKRFVELSRRRTNALNDAKGTARWWKFLEVLRKTDPVSEETIAVQLRCLLCQTELSASNESRIATSHLRNAGCCKVQASWSFCAQLLMSFSLAMPLWTAFWLLNQDNVVDVTYLYFPLTNFDMQQVVR